MAWAAAAAIVLLLAASHIVQANEDPVLDSVLVIGKEKGGLERSTYCSKHANVDAVLFEQERYRSAIANLLTHSGCATAANFCSSKQCSCVTWGRQLNSAAVAGMHKRNSCGR